MTTSSSIAHVPVYVGARLSLGLMLPAYRDLFVPLANRHEFVHGTQLRPPYFASHFDSWLESLEKDKGKNEVFAILVHDDSGPVRQHQYVGHTGVHHISYPEACAVTGSVIADPNMQGKGYGKEAKLLLQKHAFDALHLYKLKSDIKAFNAASLGHLLACGYRIYGRSRGDLIHQGKRVDRILLECFRSDWEPLWDAYSASGDGPRLSPEQRALVTKETT